MLKFFRLSFAEQRLLFLAALGLVLMRIALRFVPFRRVQRLASFSVRSSKCKVRSSACPAPERITWAVKAAARRIPGTNCLPQALVTQLLLARNGYAASVQVGVAKSVEGQFEAHAWVESEGKIVIGGSETARYQPILTLEGIGA
jgi:hypothetical protein